MQVFIETARWAAGKRGKVDRCGTSEVPSHRDLYPPHGDNLGSGEAYIDHRRRRAPTLKNRNPEQENYPETDDKQIMLEGRLKISFTVAMRLRNAF